MKQFLSVFFFVTGLLCLSPYTSVAQGCNVPLNLCQSDGNTPFESYNGALSALPPDFCFSPVNLVFIAFNTLPQEYIDANDVNYIGNAEIQITGLSCDTNQIGTPAIAAGVVAAGDPCIPNTFGQPADCVPPSLDDNISLSLSNLLPDTTYYLIINTEILENGTPFFCDFNVEISGPAVQYNLNAEASPATIINGQTALLTASSGFDNYTWSGPFIDPVTGQTAEATPDAETGEFLYNVTAEVNGCVATDQVLVNVVIPITVFNTFTPNGDGFNDVWRIPGIERFPDAEVRVFSRWGQVVYRTRGFTEWDGGNVPEAVYYYVIELNPLGFDTQPYTGSVTVVR